MFTETLELGKLADPAEFREKLNIAGEDPTLLKEELRMMTLIRKAEEKIGDMINEGQIQCPCHLTIGQEAIAAGVARHLRKTDRAFGTHRSHGHYLAPGNSVHGLFAEILGKATGCSKGMGGSMHLYGGESGFVGSVPIVAGTVSMAVGGGLAAKMDNKQENGKNSWDVGVTYFGDGAAEEGSVHESLNFASVFKIPVLFVCENNLFSSHLHINYRQSNDLVSRFAMAHNVNYRVVDGNDVVAVAKATKELLDVARAGEGPGFLEVVTYRWRGHVGPREDIDVGLKRGEELQHWKLRDPIKRLFEALEAEGHMSEKDFAALNEDVATEVNKAWEQAEKDPYPETSQLLTAVYATPKGGH